MNSQNPHIVVIMPVTFADYEGAASNRPDKFIRAVNSFLDQDYENKSLVVVHDGCMESFELLRSKYTGIYSINSIHIRKQPLFSGNVRQKGIDYAIENLDADIFCGLDSDDFFLSHHLSSIASQFVDNDFVYYDDFWYREAPRFDLHEVTLQYGSCGTSSLAWRNKPEFNWNDCDGWGHDNLFLQKLIKHSDKYEKIKNTGYVITHIKGLFDN